MKIFWKILLLTTILGMVYSCKEDCHCRDLEDCMDGQCVLQENCYYVNNQGVKGNDLYHGIAHGNTCLDTLVLDYDAESIHPESPYALLAKVPPHGLIDVAVSLTFKTSDNDFVLSSVTPICSKNGHYDYYASYIHCVKMKDSILMDVKLRSDLAGGVVDSFKMTMYK